MQTVRLAQKNGYKCVMSHRSGESEDAFISDFAVALNCDLDDDLEKFHQDFHT
jgi:enolase